MRVIKLIAIVSMLFACVGLVGCAAPANYKAMTVVPTASVKKNVKLNETIAVGNVIGGKKSSLSISVENEALKKAMEGSLSAYGYLSYSPDKAKYKLDIALVNIDKPMVGFNLDVKSTILYKMLGKGMDREYKITASGVAKMSEAYTGEERMRMATERSIEENIKKFLSKLSNL